MVLRHDDVDLGRDRDLVSRYQAGDPRAFDDLYTRYFDRLQRFCRRLTADAHEAEEVAQEAFVRAHRSMHSLHGDKRFYPWVTVIARRIIIDRQRKAARIELRDEIDAGSVAPDVDHLFDAVEFELVRAAMAQVGPRHREVLELREAEGLSYAEIAERLDVPVTTVEALLHRARKALRREYANVSGTSRGLYGLPLIGWLATRAGGLRARAADRWIEIAAFAAPAAVAAVTAAVVILPGGGDSSEPVAAPPVPSAIEIVGDPVTPEPAEPVIVTPTAPAPATTASPSSTSTSTPVVPPAATIGPVDVFTGAEGTEQAADEARDLPTGGEVGPATFGADVMATVVDTFDYLLGTSHEPTTEDPALEGAP